MPPLNYDAKRIEAISQILTNVAEELNYAMPKHPAMKSAHEAYSVILEELDEFWVEVKKRKENRNLIAMRTELIHIAAMATRAIHDLDLITF